ncbi:MAG: HAD family hydrolase [Porticoccaceae bacterium]
MSLALFDLDNTLLAGDSDYSWGQFIVSKGLVDAETYSSMNQKFYEDYLRGELDAYLYQKFCISPLKDKSLSEMDELHREFMHSYIDPLWLPKAEELIEKHRDASDRLIVITATNRFIVAPIVRKLGIADLICSEPGIEGEKYNGKLVDEPCMGPGKVSKLKRWMQAEGENLQDSIFYSDSHNDLPLLSQVDYPVAVDPDDTLRSVAEENGWPIISLR